MPRQTRRLHEVACNYADCPGTNIAKVQAMSRLGRILVVDDEANARTALAELLRDEGYEVETAADAFKALGKYESFAPHIVVTDLKMPGMDGIELVKKIRATDDVTGIIVMTAFGAVQSAIEAMGRGRVGPRNRGRDPPADAAGVRGGGPGGAQPRDGVDHRRERYGQGAGGQC